MSRFPDVFGEQILSGGLFTTPGCRVYHFTCCSFNLYTQPRSHMQHRECYCIFFKRYFGYFSRRSTVYRQVCWAETPETHHTICQWCTRSPFLQIPKTIPTDLRPSFETSTFSKVQKSLTVRRCSSVNCPRRRSKTAFSDVQLTISGCNALALALGRFVFLPAIREKVSISQLSIRFHELGVAQTRQISRLTIFPAFFPCRLRLRAQVSRTANPTLQRGTRALRKLHPFSPPMTPPALPSLTFSCGARLVMP